MSDGTFRGKQYFSCQDNCAMFVAMDKLSCDGEGSDSPAATHPSDQSYTGQDPQHQQMPSHPVTWPAAAAAKEEEEQEPVSLTQPCFKVKDRVIVYDKNDCAVHGTVSLVGKCSDPNYKGTFVVGIETVSFHLQCFVNCLLSCFSSDL